jgi:ribonuclease VapC
LIIDTSALTAIIFGEADADIFSDAIMSAQPVLPAPVITELHLVAQRGGHARIADAVNLIILLEQKGAETAPFDRRHADITATARDLYGKGNGKGGLLNFGDLMVYAIAKDRGQPLLCKGSDFASTDLVLHPASRIDP